MKIFKDIQKIKQKNLKHYNQKKHYLILVFKNLDNILNYLIKQVQLILLLKKCLILVVHSIIKK